MVGMDIRTDPVRTVGKILPPSRRREKAVEFDKLDSLRRGRRCSGIEEAGERM